MAESFVKLTLRRRDRGPITLEQSLLLALGPPKDGIPIGPEGTYCLLASPYDRDMHHGLRESVHVLGYAIVREKVSGGTPPLPTPRIVADAVEDVFYPEGIDFREWEWMADADLDTALGNAFAILVNGGVEDPEAALAERGILELLGGSRTVAISGDLAQGPPPPAIVLSEDGGKFTTIVHRRDF
jgi:hypothetical protein